MLHATIMAGGSGTRFWPASRADVPKQLLNLVGDQTMIQATVARLGKLVPPERVLVVTNERLVQSIADELPQLSAGAVLGEPERRDTAPCIGLAAGWVSRTDPDATMLVMPADHVIGPDEQFHEAILEAAQLVDEDPERLITFGIRPTYPAESFGYIEPGAKLETPSPTQLPVYHVRKFHEKPAADVAQKYLEAGTFFWNSGIFVWKASTILAALRRFEPQMYGHLARIVEAIDTREFSSVLRREFAAIKGRSIDYAVMERSEQVAVVQAPFAWDDVGSWHAIARLCGTDESGNTIVGKHLGIDTTGSIVRGRNDHLIVTLGLKDVIVVHTPDATLVASKQNEEAIRHVVKQLEQKGWQEYL